jgi:phospholipase C
VKGLAPIRIFCWPDGSLNQGHNLPILSLPHPWAAAVALCFALLIAQQPAIAADLTWFETIVVLYPENRSFDHLYGLFPGANGIANASREQAPNAITMVACFPVCTFGTVRGSRTPRFPVLPNAPFRIDAPPVSLSADQVLLSPIHAYHHNIEQINGGRNDMFAAMSTVGGYTMGYFDGSQMKLWQWAKEFTLADNFCMGASAALISARLIFPYKSSLRNPSPMALC